MKPLKSAHLNVKCTPEQHAMLLGLAAREGVTLSALLLRTLDLAAGPEARALAAAKLCPPVKDLLAVHDHLMRGAYVAGQSADFCRDVGDDLGTVEAEVRFTECSDAADRVARMVTLARAAEAVRGEVTP